MKDTKVGVTELDIVRKNISDESRIDIQIHYHHPNQLVLVERRLLTRIGRWYRSTLRFPCW